MAALLVLAGCRESDQGRILEREPGLYQGTPDQELSEETLDELRRRATLQGGV